MAGIEERLQLARRSKGWTQEHAAKEIGVSVMTVSRWERGEHIPGGELLRAASKAYGRSTEWILHGEQRDEPREQTVSPYRAFEQAIADEAITDPAILADLRSIRYRGGDEDATYEEALHQIGRLKAKLRGRASAERGAVISKPLGEGKRPLSRRRRSTS